MSLVIYNTALRNKEAFLPLTPGQVKLYACGVTVYDRCHLGHARASVVFDVVYRYLLFSGYQVSYVRNFTDIDDKIIRRAEEKKIFWKDLTCQNIVAFHEDMEALGNLPPTVEPRATDHIADMIALIVRLIENNLAYVAGGDVFFRVKSFQSYGALSHKNIDDLESGARVEVMESKEDPLDFALWKSAKPGEPFWESPWGAGRPGWHIECSAMSMRYLGETFDLHAGGRDLIFPHHENEIAQSTGATGKPFARYWLHNGFVNINADKMSKSLGNFLTIQEVLTKHDAEVVRAFLLSVHYRSPIDFTEQNLADMQQGLERYYLTVQRARGFLEQKPSGLQREMPEEDRNTIAGLSAEITASMDDDFNTVKLLGQVFSAVRSLNKLLDEFEKQKPAVLFELAEQFLAAAAQVGRVLGCVGVGDADFFARQKSRFLKSIQIDESVILQKIKDRHQARLEKNFKRADEIRDECFKMGIELKDSAGGRTEWMVRRESAAVSLSR